LKQGGFKPGIGVCVYGAGPIGLYMIQAAKIMGAGKVAAVDVNDKKMSIASHCGADAVFNGLDKEVANKVYEYFGDGADLTADITGVPVAQHNCILSTAKLGTVVILGISHQGLQLSERAVDNIMRGQISVKGSWNSFSNPFPGWEWTQALELMATGKIDYQSIITHELPLEDVPLIFDQIYQGKLFLTRFCFFHGCRSG